MMGETSRDTLIDARFGKTPRCKGRQKMKEKKSGFCLWH